jgi:effector-binding domain-containing protein
VEVIEPARVEQRPKRTYVGIRVITPFRGMLKVRDELLQELREWIEESDTETIGHGFLRLHVIDMDGPMDIEVGVVTREPSDHEGRVSSGVLPAGRYATLRYTGASGRRPNGAVIDWAHDNGLEFDRRDVPEGDLFACRYEAYLTDPKVEPLKKNREIELGFKLAN